MTHYLGSSRCSCGRKHTAVVGICREVSRQKPFLPADQNTYAAAGQAVASILQNSGILFCSHVFQKAHLEPNVESVGSAIMHFDPSRDLILGIGLGVINDIGKILSCVSGRKYIIAATAPSMSCPRLWTPSASPGI